MVEKKRGITQYLPEHLRKKSGPAQKSKAHLRNFSLATLTTHLGYGFGCSFVLYRIKLSFSKQIFLTIFLALNLTSSISSLYTVFTSCRNEITDPKKFKISVLVTSILTILGLLVMITANCIFYFMYWVLYDQQNLPEGLTIELVGLRLLILSVPFIVLSLWFWCISKHVKRFYEISSKNKEKNNVEENSQYNSFGEDSFVYDYDFVDPGV